MKITSNGRSFKLSTSDIKVFIVATFLIICSVSINDSAAVIVPPKYSGLEIMGSLRSDLVIIDKVQICGCWTGPHGQAQKKVKMRIQNQSGQTLSLGGGTGSSIRLVVDFPESYTPILSFPRVGSESFEYLTSVPTVPAAATLTVTNEREEYHPAQIVDRQLLTDLGVPDGRHAFVIPASPNKLVEKTGENSITFPTFVEPETLSSGDSYYDPARGKGDWVFLVPYGPQGEGLASGLQVLDPERSESDLYEEYFRVLGIVAVGGDGIVLGFSPLPPETALSHAGQF